METQALLCSNLCYSIALAPLRRASLYPAKVTKSTEGTVKCTD